MTIVCACMHCITCEPEDGLNYFVCDKCGREYEVCVEISQISKEEEEDE